MIDIHIQDKIDDIRENKQDESEQEQNQIGELK